MNITNFTATRPDGTTEEWIDIDWGNDQHTSMSQATYEAMQAQSTPTGTL